MSNPTYAQIAPFLLEHFPEFKETGDYKRYDENDLKLPYIVWADFIRYLLQRLQKNGPADSVVQRLFAFLNEQFNDPASDPEVINLLAVEVFESFTQKKENLDFARKYTTSQARHQLELILGYTGVERPDLSIAPGAQQIMDNIRKYKESKRTKKDTTKW